MTTLFVGIKEFRANMSKIMAAAIKNKQKIVVRSKDEPLFELRPLSKKEVISAKFALAIKKGEEDFKNGRWHTLEEVEKRYGLK